MTTYIFKIKQKNHCDYETANMRLQGKYYISNPIIAEDLDEAAEIWGAGYDEVEENAE